jgi:hypothetical protein
MAETQIPCASKTCTRCGEQKPLTEFRQSKTSPDGHRPNCAECHEQWQARYGVRVVNPEKARARHAIYYATAKGWAKRIIAAKHFQCQKKDIPCDITWQDLLHMREMATTCPYYPEITLTYATGRECNTTASLDRIIPELGYVKENCVLISAKANRQKQDMSLADVENMAAVLRRLSRRA